MVSTVLRDSPLMTSLSYYDYSADKHTKTNNSTANKFWKAAMGAAAAAAAVALAHKAQRRIT